MVGDVFVYLSSADYRGFIRAYLFLLQRVYEQCQEALADLPGLKG